MKAKWSILLLLTSMVFVSGQDKQAKVDYFANNGFGNSVYGYSGEHYKGVTYIAYQGPLEDPYIAAYDHQNNKWIGPYKAGTSLLGKTPGKKIDNHGKPTLIIDNEGYIHIVFGGHGGTEDLGKNTLGDYHDGKQIHTVSKKPMDITAWEVVDNITPFGTYSQFLKMDNGDIYLFYRHGAHRSNWVYQLSKDNARTFGPVISIVLAKQTERTEEHPIIWDSWYLHFAHKNGKNISIAYNYHVCKGPKHDGERHNCYFMTFDTETDTWRNVKDKKLILPITKAYADKMTLVKNTEDAWTHNGTSSIDAQGVPHVSSYQGEDDGSKHGGPKAVQHYYWNGSVWTGRDAGLPVGARGILRAKSKNEVAFLLGYKKENMSGVAWWNSLNGAHSFTFEKNLIKANEGGFLLSEMIRNAHPEAQFIAAKKVAGTAYTAVYLLGENGPIERIKEEAHVANVKAQ